MKNIVNEGKVNTSGIQKPRRTSRKPGSGMRRKCCESRET